MFRRSPAISFIRNATQEMMSIQDMLIRDFHLGGGYRYEWNLDSRTVTFITSHGVAIADIQIIGILNVPEQTFEWAWANNSFEEELCVYSRAAQNWGERFNVSEFTTPVFACDLPKAWQCTATTRKLGEAQAAMFLDVNESKVFISLDNIQWA